MLEEESEKEREEAFAKKIIKNCLLQKHEHLFAQLDQILYIFIIIPYSNRSFSK